MSHDIAHGSGHDEGSAELLGAPGGDGHAEIPKAPEPRMITPAREDYVRPFPGPGLLWPMVWLFVAIGFLAAAKRWQGEVIGEEKAFPRAGSPVHMHIDKPGETPPDIGGAMGEK